MVVIETKSQIIEMGAHEMAQISGGSYPMNSK
jgi:bacteriocin-like protein